MEIQNIPTMTDAKFTRLIKTIKNSSYMRREFSDNSKTFLRYRGEPKITNSAGGPSWTITHYIKVYNDSDDNLVWIKNQSTHSQGDYHLTDSQMKELMDALNEVPDESLAWKN